MRITELLPNLLLIEPKVFEDHRGHFFESFREDVLRDHGLTVPFVQDNQSLSHRGILRGLHFQKTPHAQGKFVRVITGAVLDVALDIRNDSPTYGQFVAEELTASNKRMLYIPPGFAHGFATLEDNTIFTINAFRRANIAHQLKRRIRREGYEILWEGKFPYQHANGRTVMATQICANVEKRDKWH